MAGLGMDPGQFRQEVILQKEVENQDDSGEVLITFEDVEIVDDDGNPIRLLASVQPFRGSERFEDGTTKARITHMIFMRMPPPDQLVVKPRWRVKMKKKYVDALGDEILIETRFLDIDAVFNIEERDTNLELRCIEDVAEAVVA